MDMRQWLPLVAVCAGTVMLLVDVTIVTVALPDMARGRCTWAAWWFSRPLAGLRPVGERRPADRGAGVQGLGAAAMFATAMALISSSYSGRDRGIVFGIWTAVNGAASAAGPVAGGCSPLTSAGGGSSW